MRANLAQHDYRALCKYNIFNSYVLRFVQISVESGKLTKLSVFNQLNREINFFQ